MLCQLKSCQKCGGDLVMDTDEWRCWQCGRYYYPKPPEFDPPLPQPEPQSLLDEIIERSPRRRRRSRWAMDDINTLIVAKDRSEQRWWTRNRVLIQHLDEGRSVKEIATLIARSERQVRVVREQLRDLRAVTEPEAQAA